MHHCLCSWRWLNLEKVKTQISFVFDPSEAVNISNFFLLLVLTSSSLILIADVEVTFGYSSRLLHASFTHFLLVVEQACLHRYHKDFLDLGW